MCQRKLNEFETGKEKKNHNEGVTEEYCESCITLLPLKAIFERFGSAYQEKK